MHRHLRDFRQKIGDANMNESTDLKEQNKEQFYEKKDTKFCEVNDPVVIVRSKRF